MKKFMKPGQRGFVGVVFLAIALIGIVIAAISAMSRSSSSGTADQTAKTNASIVLKQASDFKTGIDRMIVNGSSAASITFDATASTGLFDPTPGAQFAVKHIPPGAVFTTLPGGGATFYYSKLVKLPGIGSSTADDYVATVGPITIEVCRQINRTLYNDLATAAPAVSAGTLAAWTTTPAAVDDSASAVINYKDRPEGCVAATGGEYVYYKALVEN